MQGVNRSKGCLWSRINARMIKARSRETPGKMKSAGREDRCPAQHTAPPHSVSCTGAGRDAARSLSRTCLAKQHRCPADSSVLRLLARHRTAPDRPAAPAVPLPPGRSSAPRAGCDPPAAVLLGRLLRERASSSSRVRAGKQHRRVPSAKGPQGRRAVVRAALRVSSCSIAFAICLLPPPAQPTQAGKQIRLLLGLKGSFLL